MIASRSRPSSHSPSLVSTPFLPDENFSSALAAEGLPTGDFLDDGRVFLAFQTNVGERVAYGGYEPFGHDVLLRSIIIDPRWRGKGLARQVVDGLLDHARLGGAAIAYALTTEANSWLGRLGFSPVARSEAPPSILGTKQASALCPASATLWRKDLSS